MINHKIVSFSAVQIYDLSYTHILLKFKESKEPILIKLSYGMLLKRRMANGKWEVGNGKWEMGSGKWKMGNGNWEMGTGNGKLKIVEIVVKSKLNFLSGYYHNFWKRFAPKKGNLPMISSKRGR